MSAASDLLFAKVAEYVVETRRLHGLVSTTAAAPLTRNASISSGTPLSAVIRPVAARPSSSNGNRVSTAIPVRRRTRR